MMSCKEIAERASALIDGDASMGVKLQMHLHLAMCKGCHAFVHQMRTTRDLAAAAIAADEHGAQEIDDRVSDIFSSLHKDKKSDPSVQGKDEHNV